MSRSDPTRKVEKNNAFACGAGAKCEAVALSAHAPNNPRQRSDVVIQKKYFYVRRTFDLWIAALNTLQTVQSFAMTNYNIFSQI